MRCDARLEARPARFTDFDDKIAAMYARRMTALEIQGSERLRGERLGSALPDLPGPVPGLLPGWPAQLPDDRRN